MMTVMIPEGLTTEGAEHTEGLLSRRVNVEGQQVVERPASRVERLWKPRG